MRSLIVLTLLFLSTPAFAAETVYSKLTEKTVLEQENLTVGDLFTNTGEHAGYVLAPAPAPGKSLTLNRNDLQRVATAFKLNWLPPADFIGITLQSTPSHDENMALVPVLNRPLAPGMKIGEGDLTEIYVAKDKLRAQTLTDKNALIGLTPRRTLSANMILSEQDVMQPILVKRNELVSVTYKNGAISLTAKARALGDGAKGDLITFMNLSSKKPFEATVSGLQQAEINIGEQNS